MPDHLTKPEQWRELLDHTSRYHWLMGKAKLAYHLSNVRVACLWFKWAVRRCPDYISAVWIVP